MASSSTQPRAETDPELTRQLDAAHGSERPVEAVLMLRGADGATYRSDIARQQADSIVARVAREVGVAPEAVNVLANLGMVVVAAREPFVRRLLDQPEFASAAANGRDGHGSYEGRDGRDGHDGQNGSTNGDGRR